MIFLDIQINLRLTPALSCALTKSIQIMVPVRPQPALEEKRNYKISIFIVHIHDAWALIFESQNGLLDRVKEHLTMDSDVLFGVITVKTWVQWKKLCDIFSTCNSLLIGLYT